MAVYKRGEVWWFKFVWNGELIRASTKQGNKRLAEQMEATRKASLAKGEVGIKELLPAPTFAKFSERFLSWAEAEKKPSTVKYYHDMVRILLRFAPLAAAKLTKVDRDLIAKYAEKRRGARKTGVLRGKNGIQHTVIDRSITTTALNHEVGTIRRMLNLAADWGVIEHVPKIRLSGAAKQTERILSHSEESDYLNNAPQLLRDFATICLDTAMRPGEILALRWETVFFASKKQPVGYVQVLDGKTRNAKRTLIMTDRVAQVMEQRRRAHDGDDSGWVFPGNQEDGSLNYSSIDSQHDRLVEKIKLNGRFRLYDLRHTALTRLAESDADAFAIQKIAGHSDIRITSRYVHPTPEHIQKAFTRLQEYNARQNKQKPQVSEPGRTAYNPKKRSA